MSVCFIDFFFCKQDWDYYITRFSNQVQKIITIPAAFQSIENPVPRVSHPDWLAKLVSERENAHKQRKLTYVCHRKFRKFLFIFFFGGGVVYPVQ